MTTLDDMQNHLIQRLEEENAQLRDGIRQMFDNIAHEKIVRNQGAVPSAIVYAETEARYQRFMALLRKS